MVLCSVELAHGSYLLCHDRYCFDAASLGLTALGVPPLFRYSVRACFLGDEPLLDTPTGNLSSRFGDNRFYARDRAAMDRSPFTPDLVFRDRADLPWATCAGQARPIEADGLLLLDITGRSIRRRL